jgi:hypothetical protein
MTILSERLFANAEIAGLAGSLDQLELSNTANANVLGGVPVFFRIELPDGVSDNTDITLGVTTKIIDVRILKTDGAGGVGDTIQLQTAGGADNITNPISIDIADEDIARADEIDDDFDVITSGGILRISRVNIGGANVAVDIYVFGLRV